MYSVVDTKHEYRSLLTVFAAEQLAAVFDAYRLAGKLASAEHFRAAKIGGFHFATKSFAEIGREGVAIIQSIFGDDELAFGIEDDEVSVVADCEAAFAFVAAGESCGGFGHPAHDIGEREAAFGGFGVHQWQGEGEASNSAPGGAKASFGEALHFRRARRVVGGDEVNGSLA